MSIHTQENLKKLTIVVCTKNSANMLEGCLKYIREHFSESELIVVDADSADNTIAIAQKYANKVVSDQKRGLSHARQLGIDTAMHNAVAFVGSDNMVPPETMAALMEEFKKDQKLAGVQPLTVINHPKNYWEWATKTIFELLLSNTGHVDTIGTPCIFRKDVVSVIRYDEDIKGGADDTALCLKLINAGYTLKRIDAKAFEEQDLNFTSFFARWKFYGRGDNEFYKKYRSGWKFKRKLKSLSHPLRSYLLKGSLKAIKHGKFTLLPALVVATYARYYGWISFALKK